MCAEPREVTRTSQAGRDGRSRRHASLVSLVAYARAPMPYLFESEEHAAVRERARGSRRPTSRRTAPHGRRTRSSRSSCTRPPRKAGIIGIGYPEAVGGQGGDLGHVLVASDELMLAGRSVGTLVGLGRHGIALPPIVRFGTPEQQRAVRRAVPAARARSRALAITEPGGGSDVASLRPRAPCATAITTSSPARRRSSPRARARTS